MKYFLHFFAFTLLLPVYTTLGFLDITGDGLYDYSIQWALKQGIVSGYPDGTFKSSQDINRAEFIKIIIESVYSEEEINNCGESPNHFSDVNKSDWFAKYICVAQRKDIVNGYDDGTFRPSNTLLDIEAWKILFLTYGFEFNIDNNIVTDQWYLPYLQKAGEIFDPQKILIYDENKKELPHNTITRGSMTYMIHAISQIETPLSQKQSISKIYNNSDIKKGDNQIYQVSDFIELENGDIIATLGLDHNCLPGPCSNVLITPTNDISPIEIDGKVIKSVNEIIYFFTSYGGGGGGEKIIIAWNSVDNSKYSKAYNYQINFEEMHFQEDWIYYKGDLNVFDKTKAEKIEPTDEIMKLFSYPFVDSYLKSSHSWFEENFIN